MQYRAEHVSQTVLYLSVTNLCSIVYMSAQPNLLQNVFQVAATIHYVMLFLSLLFELHMFVYIMRIAFICFPFMYNNASLSHSHHPLFSIKLSSIMNLSALGIFDWCMECG